MAVAGEVDEVRQVTATRLLLGLHALGIGLMEDEEIAVRGIDRGDHRAEPLSRWQVKDRRLELAGKARPRRYGGTGGTLQSGGHRFFPPLGSVISGETGLRRW